MTQLSQQSREGIESSSSSSNSSHDSNEKDEDDEKPAQNGNIKQHTVEKNTKEKAPDNNSHSSSSSSSSSSSGSSSSSSDSDSTSSSDDESKSKAIRPDTPLSSIPNSSLLPRVVRSSGGGVRRRTPLVASNQKIVINVPRFSQSQT
jgi:hypothetical protein